MKNMSMAKDEFMECLAVAPTLRRFLFGGMYAMMMIRSTEGGELKDALRQVIAERPNLVVWVEYLGLQLFKIAKDYEEGGSVTGFVQGRHLEGFN